MFLKLAWRNIWRNKRRSAVTLAAVGLNTAVLITMFGLISGITDQFVFNATQLVVGDAQVHAAGYLDDRSLYKSIPDAGVLLASLGEAGIGAAPRTFGYGLMSVGTKSAGASFWGVDPLREKSFFALPGRLAEGSYLPAKGEGTVVLGRKIARSLHAKVGDELVAVVQAADGSMGNELFRVGGILKAAGDDIDRNAALLHHADFDRLFLTGDRVHEIAINAKLGLQPERIRDQVAVPEGAELQTWRELLPTVSDMLNMQNTSIWIIAFVFLLAAGMGVLNTMLMATHDRTREYGVLKALGCGRWRLMRDVAAEALVLAVLAGAIGSIMGVAGAQYLQTSGIDLSAMGGDQLSFGGVAYDAVWRARLEWADVWKSNVVMWGICLISALYPAIRVARLEPVQAMTQV